MVGNDSKILPKPTQFRQSLQVEKNTTKQKQTAAGFVFKKQYHLPILIPKRADILRPRSDDRGRAAGLSHAGIVVWPSPLCDCLCEVVVVLVTVLGMLLDPAGLAGTLVAARNAAREARIVHG